MEIDFLNTDELSEVEILRGKILTPETIRYLKSVFTELTVAAAAVDLHPDPAQREANTLLRAFDGGKRAFIAELLEGAASAPTELAIHQSHQST